MADALLNDPGYQETFGEHAVPGFPVTLWDARSAPIVLEPQTGFADRERGLCMTVAIAGGAYECGDVRLAHALPALRTLNRVRAPVLLYGSGQAQPTPVVAARVMLPASRGTPTSVRAVLWVGRNSEPLVSRATRDWAGSEWVVGQPRRIALSYDAANDPQGVYQYKLEVTAVYPDNTTGRSLARGSLAVVNRRDSPFGAGWWLAGLEQLQCIECGTIKCGWAATEARACTSPWRPTPRVRGWAAPPTGARILSALRPTPTCPARGTCGVCRAESWCTSTGSSGTSPP
ncbi:MAG TPA: hypothetical protein VEY93_14735 [Longimicrobium sp.]|nr:hypothetical protein [Longimicrobium sp.]